MPVVARRVVSTAAATVVAPIAVYLALTAIGTPPVWALVVGYVRTRRLTTLGLLVPLRFGLDIAVAAITGDPQLQLAKDFAITGVIGVVAVVSLSWRRPLIARIRRELSGRPEAFEESWRSDGAFRALHRRMTLVWAVALVREAVIGIVLVYALPLTAAVIVTSVLGPDTLFGLIGWTEYASRTLEVRDVADDREVDCSGCPVYRHLTTVRGATETRSSALASSG